MNLKNMRECDNNKIHRSNNSLLSVCLLMLMTVEKVWIGNKKVAACLQATSWHVPDMTEEIGTEIGSTINNPTEIQIRHLRFITVTNYRPVSTKVPSVQSIH